MRALRIAALVATLGSAVAPGVSWAGSEAASLVEGRVTHVSSEHAYVDVGGMGGVAVGDTLEVWRDDERVGEAVTVFVARHSAACRPLSGPPLRTGDRIVARVVAAPSQAASTTAPGVPENASPPSRAASEVRGGGSIWSRGRVHGSLSTQWYHARLGEDDGRIEIDEPTARLTLGARRLFDQNLDVRIRFRLRRDEVRSPSGSDEREWQDRVYELTVAYASRGGATSVRMGRLAPRAVTGIGYVDGVSVSQTITGRTRIGLVGGRRVSWASGGTDPIIEKYGVYVESERPGRTRVTGTLAAVAEYQAGDINREYVSARAGVRRGVLDVSQLAEIDVNRGWRNDRAGDRFTLARVRSTLRLVPVREVRVRVSYDSTERTWNAMNRSIPDSLFDDAMRHGLRASADLEPARGWTVRLGGGVRGREGETETTRSWEAALSARRLPIPRLGVHLRASGFEGDLARGVRPEARVDMNLRGGHRVELAAGRYRYETDFTDAPRVNDWVRAEAYLRLSPLSLRTSLELDRGDDAPGRRVLSELTYHF